MDGIKNIHNYVNIWHHLTDNGLLYLENVSKIYWIKGITFYRKSMIWSFVLNLIYISNLEALELWQKTWLHDDFR